MSPIGRIFIVLNLILSAAFLGWASNALATGQDLKQDLADQKSDYMGQLQQKDEELSQLQVDSQNLTEAQRTFREQRDQVQAKVDNLEGQLADQTRRNDSIESDLAKIQTTLQGYNDTIAQLSAEKDRAFQRASEMETERNEAVDTAQAAEMARRDAEEAQNASQTAIADLQRQNTSLQGEITSLETRLAVVVETTGANLKDIQSQPQIEAAVLDVRLDLPPGLVMLNVGRNQSVQPGFTFEIYRGAQYKGQVRVENVQENVCSAVITNTVNGTTMSQGDRAATYL